MISLVIEKSGKTTYIKTSVIQNAHTQKQNLDLSMDHSTDGSLQIWKHLHELAEKAHQDCIIAIKLSVPKSVSNSALPALSLVISYEIVIRGEDRNI